MPSRRRGGRVPAAPLIEVTRAAERDDALAALERWKAAHPSVAARLEPADVLVDAMRGGYTTWTRIRVNLRNVPEEERPEPTPVDPATDPAPRWSWRAADLDAGGAADPGGGGAADPGAGGAADPGDAPARRRTRATERRPES